MEKSLEENSKDKFLFDTSAFLSLESAHTLATILEVYLVLTTRSVLKELEEFSQHDDLLGMVAKRILAKRDKFTLREVLVTERIDYISSIDEELFNVSLQEKVTLITDDLKLIHHSKGKIKIAVSTYFLLDFFKWGFFTKEQVLTK